MNLDHVFGALADPTRRAILARLALGEEFGQRIWPRPLRYEPARRLQAPESAGACWPDPQGAREAQSRPCRIEPETLKAVDDWLEDYRRLWNESLDRLEDYLKTLQAKAHVSGPKEKKNVRRKKMMPFVKINAPLARPKGALVWDCYTQEKHLKNWWGPKGFTMLKCTLDLRLGGVFHYGMEGPGRPGDVGQVGIPQDRKAASAEPTASPFSDVDGGITRSSVSPRSGRPPRTAETSVRGSGRGMPKSAAVWESGEATQAEIEAFTSAHAGMNAGCEGTFSQLDAYLKTL